MKRGAKCIAQTINLANPETCVRPKRVQKLVSADAARPRSDSNRASNYRTPSRPVTIKVCTRKDMQRACPPKIRDCPPTKLPTTSGQKLCRAVIFLIKGAIAAGLIYWTYSEGLWSDSDKTEDLYHRMMSTIVSVVSDRPDADNVEVPHLEGMKYSVLEGYNHTLMKVMDIIVGVPLEMHRKLRDILFPCDEAKKEPPTHRHPARNSTET